MDIYHYLTGHKNIVTLRELPGWRLTVIPLFLYEKQEGGKGQHSYKTLIKSSLLITYNNYIFGISILMQDFFKQRFGVQSI